LIIFEIKCLIFYPSVPIIFGGANCEGEMGITLLKSVPSIDYVCSGEGDTAFVSFVKSFLEGKANRINGIITRESSAFEAALTSPVMNMDDLPYPDFDDYFSALGASPMRKHVSPGLVIETSRGCWWGEKFQCTFCGLNRSTMKYRKSLTFNF
jgi:radical SAM superfamily enzyme YgiQ (UPF0313 family)